MRLVTSRNWAWFKKGSGTFAGTAGHRPKVGQVLRTKVPDPFLNHARNSVSGRLSDRAFFAEQRRAGLDMTRNSRSIQDRPFATLRPG